MNTPTPPKPKKRNHLTMEQKAALFDDIRSHDREQLQARLNKDCAAVVAEFGARHNRDDSSMRRYLEGFQFHVPPLRVPKPAPAPAPEQAHLPFTPNPVTLREQIENAINCTSAENGSDTPDFILAEFLMDCLEAFDKASNARRKWHGIEVRRTPASRPLPITPPPASDETQEAH